jgi:hypothetical protein
MYGSVLLKPWRLWARRFVEPYVWVFRWIDVFPGESQHTESQPVTNKDRRRDKPTSRKKREKWGTADSLAISFFPRLTGMWAIPPNPS